MRNLVSVSEARLQNGKLVVLATSALTSCKFYCCSVKDDAIIESRVVYSL
jgi:hypothetical protein